VESRVDVLAVSGAGGNGDALGSELLSLLTIDWQAGTVGIVLKGSKGSM
jgi:hypothetical protein